MTDLSKQYLVTFYIYNCKTHLYLNIYQQKNWLQGASPWQISHCFASPLPTQVLSTVVLVLQAERVKTLLVSSFSPIFLSSSPLAAALTSSSPSSSPPHHLHLLPRLPNLVFLSVSSSQFLIPHDVHSLSFHFFYFWACDDVRMHNSLIRYVIGRSSLSSVDLLVFSLFLC